MSSKGQGARFEPGALTVCSGMAADGSSVLTPSRVAEWLRKGACPTDWAFDGFLPEDLRAVSGDFWTPLAVAVQVARWLGEFSARTVIDIGAGPGKLCIAAALAGNCEFLGLEHRPRFVAIARTLARHFDVTNRVRFLRGSLSDTRLPVADAYYLYNPFGENLFGPDDCLARDVELSTERYLLDIMAVQELFRRAKAGTIVLTYNGFGGSMPESYEHLRVDDGLPCALSLWRKSAWAQGEALFSGGAEARHESQ